MKQEMKLFKRKQFKQSSVINTQSKKKTFINKTKPSPTNQRIFAAFARKPQISQKDGRCRPTGIRGFIEGISLPACFWKGLSAGMTVEAAMVLPMFLFFFLYMGCAMEMIRLHGNLQLALWQTGSQLAVYGYALDSGETPASGEDDGEGGWWKNMAGAAFASTFVRARLIDSAGRDYLEQSPLHEGAEGLALWESEMFGPGDEIDIVVTYSVSPWGGLAPLPAFRMANRYYAHIWNGYRLPGEGGESGESGRQTVFVSENGSVYHMDRNCTYLLLSVRQVSAEGLGDERNLYGGRYRACGKCRGEEGDAIFYITETGDCFHYSRECPGIKRTVSSVSMAEAAGYRPCSRCGNRH